MSAMRTVPGVRSGGAPRPRKPHAFAPPRKKPSLKRLNFTLSR